jgi:hypothetical protein
MPQVRLDLDSETYRRLAEHALAERRPVNFQAEVTLRRALGLPVPYPPAPEPATDAADR